MNTQSLPAGGIVVGVDGSAPGDLALAWATEEARNEGRPLVIVNATGSLGTVGTVWLSEDDPEPAAVLRQMRHEGEEIVASAARRVARMDPAVGVHTAVVADDARQVLLGLAAEATMVVVGSRGRGPVRSLLLGSVSAAVARHALCPVVVIRPHHPGVVRRGVLVGADGTPASTRTLEFAYRQASARRLPLTVMDFVWDVVAATNAPHVVVAGNPAVEDARLLLAESMAGLAEKYPDVHATTEIGRGLPEQCLAPAADRMDLVVVGRHRTPLVPRLLHWDVAGSLVEHARTAVAVVPEASGPTDPGPGDQIP